MNENVIWRWTREIAILVNMLMGKMSMFHAGILWDISPTMKEIEWDDLDQNYDQQLLREDWIHTLW